MKLAKLRVFAAHDSKLGVFMTPFFMQHLGQASRAWEDLCNDSQSIIAKHPADFVLYEIGEFDDDKGLLTHHTPLIRVSSALEARASKQDQLPLGNR